jgi:hypothetical protein
MATTPIGTGAAFDDSNVAMMGSDAAHDAMRDAAALDPAWESAGTAAGIEIWRVENHARTAGDAGGSGGKAAHFGIKRWTRPDVLYTGDSYIILLTKPVEDGGEGFDYDIYFWLGHESSQDERGVAGERDMQPASHCFFFFSQRLTHTHTYTSSPSLHMLFCLHYESIVPTDYTFNLYL